MPVIDEEFEGCCANGRPFVLCGIEVDVATAAATVPGGGAIDPELEEVFVFRLLSGDISAAVEEEDVCGCC